MHCDPGGGPSVGLASNVRRGDDEGKAARFCDADNLSTRQGGRKAFVLCAANERRRYFLKGVPAMIE